MTPVKFRAVAKRDLENIEHYYRAYSDQTAIAVLEDIASTIETLKMAPELGRRRSDGARKFPTTKYRFNIVHRSTADLVEILAIYRYQNRS